MKKISSLIVFILLAGCDKPAAPALPAEVPVAFFKQGHGVSIPASMRKSLGIEVAEVSEHAVTPRTEVSMQIIRKTNEKSSDAEGWLTEIQAKAIRPGLSMRVLLGDGKTVTGTVRRVERSPYSAAGDFEIIAGISAPLEAGTAVTAIIDAPLKGDVVAVPRSAILKTAEGEFVYTVNEHYFARTRVQTGAQNEELTEIIDGLYTGDQVVVAQVTPLWMTELQSLRAGQACCKGH